jgi:hypothetical protein
MRGLLHYLRDQAALTCWQPGVLGKRSWATVRKHPNTCRPRRMARMGAAPPAKGATAYSLKWTPNASMTQVPTSARTSSPARRTADLPANGSGRCCSSFSNLVLGSFHGREGSRLAAGCHCACVWQLHRAAAASAVRQSGDLPNSVSLIRVTAHRASFPRCRASILAERCSRGNHGPPASGCHAPLRYLGRVRTIRPSGHHDRLAKGRTVMRRMIAWGSLCAASPGAAELSITIDAQTCTLNYQ